MSNNFLYALSTWFLVFMIYSFVGWLCELTVTLLQGRKLYNRGFLIGPICPLYGMGGLLITALLNGTENPVVIFCVALVGSGLLEYLTSYIMEKLFHVRWWDYTDNTFNINGRITLLNLLLFGLMGIIVIYFANPFFLGLLTHLDQGLLILLAAFLLVLFVADIIGSLLLILRFRVAAGTTERDATEEISRNIRELFLKQGRLSRRLVKAFPGLEVKKPGARKKGNRKIETRTRTKAKTPAKKK